MNQLSYRWIVFVIILLIIQVSASFSDYRPVFEDKNFLLEGVFQVVGTDLDEDNINELVVSGKNYTSREMIFYWLETDSDFKPKIKWQSDNLDEDRSVLWVLSGKWKTPRNQLLVVTATHFYIYQAGKNGLELIQSDSHDLRPLIAGGGDLDGDGFSEVIIGRIGKVGLKNFDGIVQVWRLNENRWEMMTESNLIGNIRGMTVGDINQDGKNELFIEEGYQMESGNIHVYNLDDTGLKEIYCLKKAINGAVYSLRVQNLADGPKLITGSVRGKINFFAWENNSLIPVKETSLNFGIVDLEVSDLNNDRSPELVLVGYPQRLMILTPMGLTFE